MHLKSENMASSNNGPEDVYMKKIWKRLSKDKKMDEMRKALQDDEGYHRYQEEIRRKLQQIIDTNDETKTYEKIFSEFARVDNSQNSDQDLESLIREAVNLNMRSLPEETKENLFEKWDKIVDTNHKRSKTS